MVINSSEVFFGAQPCQESKNQTQWLQFVSLITLISDYGDRNSLQNVEFSLWIDVADHLTKHTFNFTIRE
jgi:hypothetical protein